MAIPARLSRQLQGVLGEQGANDLIDWMGQVESHRSELQELMSAWKVATDAQFAEFDARLELRFTQQDRRLDARFADQDRRLDARFAEMDRRLDGRFAEMDRRLDVQLAERDRRMDARFAEQRLWMESRFNEQRDATAALELRFERRFSDLIKWSFVFWCGAVGAVAMLARVLG